MDVFLITGTAYQRITGIFPCLKPAEDCVNIPETKGIEFKRCTSACFFVRSGAVEENQLIWIQI